MLKAEKVSKTAVASICTACCSIAFTSASISFDWDTSPANREIDSKFYGFVKGSPNFRTLTFLCLFSLALFHVASKLFAIALLASTNSALVTFYLCGDMAVYLTYKAARGDLRYWMNLPPALSVVVSLLARPVVKLLVS